jgi:hypothetical protein
VVAALVVGVIVVLLTMAIERLGAIGGLIASAPSTVVVAAAAFAVQGANLVDALYMVPCGMVASVTFLVLWRQLPPVCGRCVRRRRASAARWRCWLACILAWFVVAIVIEVTAKALADVVCGARRRPRLSRHAARRRPLSQHLSPVARSQGRQKDFVAHVFGSRLRRRRRHFCRRLARRLLALGRRRRLHVSRHFLCFHVRRFLVARHRSLAQCALRSMALGSTSVGVYAVLFAELYPLLFDSLQSTAGALALALPITWLIAVVTTSLPIFLLLRWLKKRQPPLETPIEALYEAEEDEVDYRVMAAAQQRHALADDDDLTALDNDSIAAGLLANAIGQQNEE